MKVKVLWCVVVIIVSSYFAFCLYPAVYKDVTDKLPILCFVVKIPQNDKIINNFYPNNPENKAQFGKLLADNNNLYYSGCSLLPLTQRSSCSGYANWITVPLNRVGCSSVINCDVYRLAVSESEQREVIKRLNTLTGDPMPPGDQNLKITEPMGWGKAAEWPLFITLIYFGIKFGRIIGEFLFKPYKNNSIK
jgi:hypothetical protein